MVGSPKWLEELYDVRSKAVHKGHHQERSWGWSIFEHLIMAAYVFPLTVKALLEREEHHALTDGDRARCRKIHRLLAATAWGKTEKRQRRIWTSIIAQVEDENSHSRLMERLESLGLTGSTDDPETPTPD